MKGGRSIQPLIVQLLTGHAYGLNTVMWFQVVLTMLTVIFTLLCWKIPLRLQTGVLAVLGLIGAYLCLSGRNIDFFKNQNYSILNCFGRFWDMVPYAVTGLLIAKYDLVEKAKSHWRLVCIVAALIVGPFQNLCKLTNWATIGYFSVRDFMLTIVFFFLCSIIPEQFFSDKARRCVQWVARYTLGIYCSHLFVKGMLKLLLNYCYISWLDRTVEGSMLVFIVSLLGCYTLSKIPLKWVKYVV